MDTATDQLFVPIDILHSLPNYLEPRDLFSLFGTSKPIYNYLTCDGTFKKMIQRDFPTVYDIISDDEVQLQDEVNKWNLNYDVEAFVNAPFYQTYVIIQHKLVSWSRMFFVTYSTSDMKYIKVNLVIQDIVKLVSVSVGNDYYNTNDILYNILSISSALKEKFIPYNLDSSSPESYTIGGKNITFQANKDISNLLSIFDTKVPELVSGVTFEI